MANFLSNRSLAGMKAESIEEPRQRPRKTRGFEGNVPLIQSIKVFLIHKQMILASIRHIPNCLQGQTKSTPGGALQPKSTALLNSGTWIIDMLNS